MCWWAKGNGNLCFRIQLVGVGMKPAGFLMALMMFISILFIRFCLVSMSFISASLNGPCQLHVKLHGSDFNFPAICSFCNAILITMPKCCGLHSSISNWNWCFLFYTVRVIITQKFENGKSSEATILNVKKSTDARRKYKNNNKIKQKQMKANKVKENGIYAE